MKLSQLRVLGRFLRENQITSEGVVRVFNGVWIVPGAFAMASDARTGCLVPLNGTEVDRLHVIYPNEIPQGSDREIEAIADGPYSGSEEHGKGDITLRVIGKTLPDNATRPPLEVVSKNGTCVAWMNLNPRYLAKVAAQAAELSGGQPVRMAIYGQKEVVGPGLRPTRLHLITEDGAHVILMGMTHTAVEPKEPILPTPGD